ncbi:cysteine--tRNA ligase [Candidatus Uhrbacteria bacterium RIFOXYB12_FULL_58_10]|nr:MAG: cysteine--tRNA ligase [Candidatus Uhrbacteria bacterium RIFOXYB12_FULL_58_10]
MIRLHNTLTRQTEKFQPIMQGKASVYSCGPTVYGYSHVGNMRAALFSDLLNRALSYNGLDVTLIMNVTDVGHLVGDADVGEDKMIVAMRREGKTAYEIAEFYARAFFQDLERLNVKPASKYPRATEHIPEQIAMIERLERNDLTYRTSDGIYFDTAKLPEYGRLSGQKSEEKLAGARVELGEKKRATDFALWKFAPEGVRREMVWPSPWGEGFPGWHIECSAMSKRYLGVPFDIHTGGIDLIPVHHENEIAQTLGADGVPEANLWMHSEFVTFDGGKMSKSLGTVFTVQDLVDRGYDPLAYRYFVLGGHYRSKINFTWEALDAAQNALNKLHEATRAWPRPADTGDPDYLERFLAAINDDFNTPEALAILWNLVNDETVPLEVKGATILRFDQIFGLQIDRYLGKLIEVPDDILELGARREAARVAKDWTESDRLRDEIAIRGFAVEDTADGPKFRLV